MPCNPELLKQVPLFARLDDDEAAVLAAQVDIKQYARNQRIYKMGDPGGRGYVLMSGQVQVVTIDDDHQTVVLDEPAPGEFFGFASMLEQKEHETEAIALDVTLCIEVDRNDIFVLIQRKPHAGMDMLAVLGHQFHVAQHLVRVRALRNPNEIIEEEATVGEHVADAVASFGGSWTFIILFGVLLTAYTMTNVYLRGNAWDPYPFILLNLFLSMLASIQAPVIMMSQNRQDKKDRLRGELDFDVNRRAHVEIQGLARKLNLMGDRLGDIEELLREQA